MGDTSIRDYYANNPDREWRRLVSDPFHRIELETTLRFLGQHLPPAGLILDAGGGPGRYTIELAKRGYTVVLLDLTPELLDPARRRVARAGLKRRVPAIVEGSIVDLSAFPSDHFDAVICLGGALSHVRPAEDRRRAVAELARVARYDAPVCISVMGLLAALFETPREWPQVLAHPSYFRKLWQTGDDVRWCGDAFAHFFRPEEFEALVGAGGLEVVARAGLEGFSSHAQPEINRLAREHPDWYEVWLELHERTCTDPHVFATSQHLLVVGRKHPA